jgi:hypothetical protein
MPMNRKYDILNQREHRPCEFYLTNELRLYLIIKANSEVLKLIGNKK